MRLFLAVELVDEVREAAAAAASRLRQRLEAAGRVDARWTPAENLHITLWFLGELDDHRAAGLAAALRQPFASDVFDVHVGGFGVFPPRGRPRVLWLGVDEGAEELRALHRELGGRLAPLGFEGDHRPFHPHLTIARVRDGGGRRALAPIAAALLDVPSEAGTSPITAVTLFQSRLSAKGAQYDALLRVPLTR